MISSASLAIIKIGVSPVLFKVGPFSVHWYGLMYVVGIAAGMYVMLPYAERIGISREKAYQVFWPIVIASLVGGRLYYVVQSNFGWYLAHPQNILATWEGGMAFYGAVFLGGITAFVWCRLKGIPFARALDAAAIFIPVAQSFGRVGNIINGDIVGYPSTLPWATQYVNQANTFVSSHTVAYQPAAAYELLFTVALFGFLWAVRYRLKVPGTLFAVWLIAYSIGQFGLFFVRSNVIVLLGLKQAQLTAIAVIAGTIPLYLLWRHFYLTRSRHLKSTATETRSDDPDLSGEVLPRVPAAER
ncbi:MAG: prolipoprotein diacylglyceryl transferase [Chloroflexota bacterium]